jgi:hypothetical protein
LKRQFKKEWDRDPELANQSLPSDSSIKREAGRKKTLSQEWAKSEPKLSQVILLSQE